MKPRCGVFGVCTHPKRCAGVCVAVAGHTGPHGCEHDCRDAVMVGSMLHYLTTGRYVEYQLVGEA